MNLHSVWEYQKYLRKARGRHGTHSPFVYDFVERVLMNKDIIDKQYRISIPDIALKYENLVSRIAQYFQYTEIIHLPADATDAKRATPDMLILNDSPKTWMETIHAYKDKLKKDGAAVVTHIHQSPAHTMAWNHLCADGMARMSMDIYKVGILFFKEEFKVPQQFVLKY